MDSLLVFLVVHISAGVVPALAIALLSGAMRLGVVPFFKNGEWERWLAQMNKRLGSESQKERRSMSEANGTQTGVLTNAIHKGTFGVTVEEHRALKHLPATQEQRDHMSIEELNLLTFVESLAASLHDERDSRGFNALHKDVTEAGEIGGAVRRLMESALGRSVTSNSNFLDQDQLPPNDDQ